MIYFWYWIIFYKTIRASRGIYASSVEKTKPNKNSTAPLKHFWTHGGARVRIKFQ